MPTWGITRRSIVGQFAAAGVALAQQENLLRTLKADHPRLLLSDGDMERLRVLIRDNPQARKLYLELEKEADRLQFAPVTEYKLVGPRLLSQSRHVLDRVYTLALTYRLSGKRHYLDRAVRELHSAASFRDWNPQHFIDVAEMTHAFAIGYDWLYAGLSLIERGWMRQAIVEKGLDQALPIYERQGSWVANRFNWNLVCNGGITMGALAVAEHEHDKSNAILKYALESVPRAITSYGPDGGWIEGPSYWQYATRYLTLFVASMESALGTDFGISSIRGFDRAGRFRIYSTGPIGKTFNFGDAAEEAGESPEMFWLGKRFSQPVFSWQEQRETDRVPHTGALDLVWYHTQSRPPLGFAWPLDGVFQGVQTAFFRSGWEDPASLFLAVKGGDNRAPHAHLDLGSFVLDAGGVRWAHDLGPDDYNLPGYFGRQRWSYYRTRTESHNTLLIDGENQDPRGEAHFTRHEFTPDLSWVQIDLSRAYPAKVKQWQRRIGVAQRQAILIEDTLKADQPVEPLWGMITDAEVSANGQSAELQKGGWTLTAEIRTPRHAVFDVVPAKAPPGQAQNSGMRKLIIRVGERTTDLDLSVVLMPHRTGQVKPKVTAKFPA